MDSLSKKIQNLGIHDLRNAARFAQNMIVQYEPYQVDIRTATNTDAWGPTPKQLSKVMRHRYQVPLYLLTEYILKRLIDHIVTRPKNLYEKARKEYVNYGSEWRVVLKCLTLLDFLLLHVDDGDEVNQIVSCLRTHKSILDKSVMNYKIQFSNDGKMEIHERSIQKKCETLLQYLDDNSHFLTNERLKQKKNSIKISRQTENSIYNDTNSNNIIVDGNYTEEDEEEGQAYNSVIDNSGIYNASNRPKRSNTSSTVKEQRRQRREILRESIKRTNQVDVPNLIDFDDDNDAGTKTSNTKNDLIFLQDAPTDSASKDDEEEEEDDDDDFGELAASNPTSSSSNKDNNNVLLGASSQEEDTTTAQPKKTGTDVFDDIFTYSKSLI